MCLETKNRKYKKIEKIQKAYKNLFSVEKELKGKSRDLCLARVDRGVFKNVTQKST